MRGPQNITLIGGARTIVTSPPEYGLFPRAPELKPGTPVIIDGPHPEFANHYAARGHADAPEIDGTVRVKGKNLKPGDIIKVKVTGADIYDLTGRAIGDPR